MTIRTRRGLIDRALDELMLRKENRTRRIAPQAPAEDCEFPEEMPQEFPEDEIQEFPDEAEEP